MESHLPGRQGLFHDARGTPDLKLIHNVAAVMVRLASRSYKKLVLTTHLCACKLFVAPKVEYSLTLAALAGTA
jgi:hypothetical protein